MRSRALSIAIFLIAVIWTTAVLFISHSQKPVAQKPTVLGKSEMHIAAAEYAGEVLGDTVSENASLPFGQTSTLVGLMSSGDGAYKTQTFFDAPHDVAFDGDGNLFVADMLNHRVRKIDSAGIVSTLAGTTEGYRDDTGAKAQFSLPQGIATDADGNVYVADTGNKRIRKISSLGITTTIASNVSSPSDVIVFGTTVFISDAGSNAILSVSVNGGKVSVISNRLKDPGQITLSEDGKIMYIANRGTHQIKSLDVATKKIGTLAGSSSIGSTDGVSTNASFGDLRGIVRLGKKIYVVDEHKATNRLRSINLSNGTVATIGNTQFSNLLKDPKGITAASGAVYAASAASGTIVRIAPATLDSETVAGSTPFLAKDGSVNIGLVGRPTALAFSQDKSFLYVLANNQLLRLDMGTTTIANSIGSTKPGYREGVPLVATGSTARFDRPQGIALTADGKTAYIADSNNNRIRKVALAQNPVTSSYLTGAGKTGTTEGNGYAEGKKCTDTMQVASSGCAYFSNPTTLALTADDATLYVADTGNNRIRKIDVATGTTSLVAGATAGFKNGKGSQAQFSAPQGLALDEAKGVLYVADTGNHRIRKIQLSNGSVTTIAGSSVAGFRNALAGQAQFSSPKGLALDTSGHLYISDTGNARVRVLDLSSGLVELASGSGKHGYVDAKRVSSRFTEPTGLAINVSQDALYVADTVNDLIRSVVVHAHVPFSNDPATPTSVSPKQIQIGANAHNIILHGKNFRSGIVVYVGKTKVSVVPTSPTTAALKIPSSLASGTYDVLVLTPDTQARTLTNALRISDSRGAVAGLHVKNPDLAKARAGLLTSL